MTRAQTSEPLGLQLPVGEIVTIAASTTDLFGRFQIQAGHNHFDSDTKLALGGPGEAVQAGELLLSALASCGLGVIQRHANALGAELRSATATVSFQRDPSDSSRYESIRLKFRLDGPDSGTGLALIKQFTDTCPIYNTLRRGGNVVVELEAPVSTATLHLL